jgi:hypothetical protein
MLLHEHPVNQARESRGELAVNSVWLYGEGTQGNIECGAIRHVYADNVLARGLALAAGLPPQALPLDAAEWLAHTPAPGTHLIVLEQPELTQLEHGWCVPLLGALRHGRLDALTLHLNTGATVVSRRIEPRDLWKFWRRRQSLTAWLNSTPHD